MYVMATMVLLLTLSFPLTMAGQTRDDATWVVANDVTGFGNQANVNGHTFNLVGDGVISGVFALGANSNHAYPIYYNYNVTYPSIRMYAGNTFTITPANKTGISKIVYSFVKANNRYASASVISPTGGSYNSGGESLSNTDVREDIWTVENPVESSVVLRLGNLGQRGLVQVTITYVVQGSGQTYTLTYVANGGTGTMEPESYAEGASAMVKPCSFIRDHYMFDKWNTNENGNGTTYYPGENITMTVDKTLYAQWIDMSSGFVSVLNTTNVNEAIQGNSGWCDWRITEQVGQYTFIYKGKSFQNNNAIQINSSVASGIVTSVSSGLASQVVVSWNSSTTTGHVLDVYGRNYPYESPEDLFGTNSGTYLGSIVNGTNTLLDIEGDYAYIGVRSANGAVFMDEIRIVWSVSSDQPFIRFSPEAVNLGNIVKDSVCSATFYVSQGYLGAGIGLSASYGSLDTTEIIMEANPTPITWTYTPTTAGVLKDTVVATSTWELEGRESITVTEKLAITALVVDSEAGDSLWVAKRNYIQNPQQNTTVVISLVGVEVVGKSGNSLYLQDDKAGLLVYGSGLPDLTTSDKFTAGSLIGDFTLYQNSIIELINFEFSGEQHTHVETLTTVHASIANLLADNSHTYEFRYVELDSVNITHSSPTWGVKLGESELSLYDKFATGYAIMTPPNVAHKFSVKGLFNLFYSSGLGKEIAPTTLGDFSTVKKATAPTFNPVGGLSNNNPVATTLVTISPADTTTLHYFVLDNREDLTDTNGPVTINVNGDIGIQAYATRDFYPNSTTITYYYKLPANTYAVNFSINGVVSNENTAYVNQQQPTLLENQCPAVDNIDPYLFRGWSRSESSTEVITDWPITEITGSMTLYAVYAVPSSYAYTILPRTSPITAGEYVIVSTQNDNNNHYTLKNVPSNGSPVAYLLSDLGISIDGGKLIGDDFSEVTWTFTGTPTDMTVTSTADPALSLYVFDNSTGVRVGYAGTHSRSWTVCEDNGHLGFYNLKHNEYSRYLTLYSGQDWRCYLMSNNLYYSPFNPMLTLFKKTPIFNDTDPSYTRIFNDETATTSVTINGPSVIPSGKYMDMGNFSITNNLTADKFLIEDGATFIPAMGQQGVRATVKKTVAGYGTDVDVKTGWYLLSSPVGQVNANGGIQPSGGAYVRGLYAGDETDYDLYIFDQDPSDGKPWRNNKATANGTIFGHWNGILYASQVDRTITYAGTLVTSCNNATLAFSGNGEFKGWNLIGNPFTCPAYISLENYYKLEVVEQDGVMVSELQLKSNDTPIEALEGVFVQANAVNQAFSFMTTAPQGNGRGLLSLKVVSGRGSVVDQAMVRFGKGQKLDKFMLHEQGTKLYIPQGDNDCAMVHVNKKGETPVNFRVARNDVYTISVEPNDVKLDYLHLIDNLTGADIDLLATPSYSFEAKTTDYEWRFRLVFVCGNDGDDNNGNNAMFADVYNGAIIMLEDVAGATLQIIDAMGRVVYCEDAKSWISTTKMTSGVYVLRLINGENVKTQKIIIR